MKDRGGVEGRSGDAPGAGTGGGGSALKRIVTGLLLLPLLAVFYWAPPLLCLALLAVGAVLSYLEICRLLESSGLHPLRIAGVLLVLALVIAFSLPSWGAGLVLALCTAALPAVYMARRLPVEKAMASLAGSLFGIVLAGVFMGFQMALRMACCPGVGEGPADLASLLLGGLWGGEDPGGGLLVFLYVTAFTGDVAALYTGRLLGRHKLAPRISPGKTWEGLAGNLVGNLGGAAAAAPLLPAAFGWADVPVLAVLIGGAAVLGDLTMSLVKRSAGVKDTGSLLPGHGGVLDRLDSLILSAPLLFYYGKYVAGL